MDYSSTMLSNMRQTAAIFAALCCAVTALAVAAPVFASEASVVKAEAPIAASPAASPLATPAAIAPAAAPHKPSEAEILANASLKPSNFVWRENMSTIIGSQHHPDIVARPAVPSV